MLERGVDTPIASCSEYQAQSEVVIETQIGFVSKTLNSTHVDPELFQFNIEYPSVTFPDRDVESEINSLMAGFVCNEKFQAYGILWERENERIKKGEHFYGSPYSLNICFDLANFQRTILSVKFAIRSYTGGAYTNGSYRTFNFILGNPPLLLKPYMIGIGDLVSIEELFKLSAEYIEEQHEVNSDSLDFDRGIEHFEHFNLLENGLAVAFDEHTLAGKWLGAPSIVIPFSRIKPIRDRLNELQLSF